jgi:hypothetical protein
MNLRCSSVRIAGCNNHFNMHVAPDPVRVWHTLALGPEALTWVDASRNPELDRLAINSGHIQLPCQGLRPDNQFELQLLGGLPHGG